MSSSSGSCLPNLCCVSDQLVFLSYLIKSDPLVNDDKNWGMTWRDKLFFGFNGSGNEEHAQDNVSEHILDAADSDGSEYEEGTFVLKRSL